MAEVVTFIGYRPPARYDSLPWTEVRIEESDLEDGLYVELETIPLVPVDPDPSEPASRSFTTQLGTAIDYWYRVIFADADGDVAQPSTPVQNVTGGTVPSVVAYSTTDEFFRRITKRSPSAEETVQAQRCLDAAALEIDAELGRATPYDSPPALVVEVNLDRAVEYWRQGEVAFGIMAMGDGAAVYTTRDSWDRHAHRLSPLKTSWGVA